MQKFCAYCKKKANEFIGNGEVYFCDMDCLDKYLKKVNLKS